MTNSFSKTIFCGKNIQILFSPAIYHFFQVSSKSNVFYGMGTCNPPSLAGVSEGAKTWVLSCLTHSCVCYVSFPSAPKINYFWEYQFQPI